MQFAKRLEKTPSYLFAKINRKQHETVTKGVNIINIGVGDPDRPTPAHIVQAMHEAINELSTHNYPPDRRTKEYRKAAADWMERRLGVAGLNIEFQSLSKSYKMTAGWVGFVVGNPTEIKGLGQVKTNVDSGIFKAIQRAAIAAR